jgi:hypothetical protein
MSDTYPINIWINDERLDKLREAGLADMTKEVLAGMRVLKIQVTEDQKDTILRKFSTAKFDSATTKSIELLPPEAKNRMFDLVISKKSLDIAGDFIGELK